MIVLTIIMALERCKEEKLVDTVMTALVNYN